MPVTVYIVALAALLSLPSDKAHRQRLWAIIGGLAALYALAGLVDTQTFYPASALLWVAVAAWSLTNYPRLKAVRVGAISLVVAGVAVFPAWLGSADLAPFASISLVLSDLCGVFAIVCFGWPGLRRVGDWVAGVGRDIGRGAFGGVSGTAQARAKSR